MYRELINIGKVNKCLFYLTNLAVCPIAIKSNLISFEIYNYEINKSLYTALFAYKA